MPWAWDSTLGASPGDARAPRELVQLEIIGDFGSYGNHPRVWFFLLLLVWLLRATLGSRRTLALENLALLRQRATYARSRKRRQLRPEERSFWMALSRLWAEWSSAWPLVTPTPVISRHPRAARIPALFGARIHHGPVANRGEWPIVGGDSAGGPVNPGTCLRGKRWPVKGCRPTWACP